MLPAFQMKQAFWGVTNWSLSCCPTPHPTLLSLRSPLDLVTWLIRLGRECDRVRLFCSAWLIVLLQEVLVSQIYTAFDCNKSPLITALPCSFSGLLIRRLCGSPLFSGRLARSLLWHGRSENNPFVSAVCFCCWWWVSALLHFVVPKHLFIFHYLVTEWQHCSDLRVFRGTF